MATESLLSKVPIPEQNIHRIHAELDAEAAAAEYEQQLVNFFHLGNQEMPRFDLIFLGIGPDGHTASLFPGSNALTESSRRVVANWVEKFKTFRITLTFPVLNHAAEVVFLVSGADKGKILSEVLRPGAPNYPAQTIQPEDGRLLWLVDKDAGVCCALPRLQLSNFPFFPDSSFFLLDLHSFSIFDLHLPSCERILVANK